MRASGFANTPKICCGARRDLALAQRELGRKGRPFTVALKLAVDGSFEPVVAEVVHFWHRFDHDDGVALSHQQELDMDFRAFQVRLLDVN